MSSETAAPVRLDVALTRRGLATSRTRARQQIEAGHVTVDGRPATRASQPVSEDQLLAVDAGAPQPASRAGAKLAAALDAFAIDPAGNTCLDIGSSTGGFTEVLLQRGARHVTAIDVGHGQMLPDLAADPRVTLVEGVNARHLGPQHVVEGPPNLVVCDVSFISLRLALPPALALAAPGARLVGLVKPQFEAGPGQVGKGGIVRDEKVHRRVCDRIETWLRDDMGWTVIGLIRSPVSGSDGNREFLVAAAKP